MKIKGMSHVSLLLAAAVLACGMIFWTGQPAFAYGAEEGSSEPETVVCDTPPEYVEAVGELDPEGSSSFAAKRLMVFMDEGALTDSFGAINSVYYTAGSYYLLEYDSPAQTKAACQALKEVLGEDKVFVDQILTLEATPDPLKNPQEMTNATPGYESASYGIDLMHLDKVRDDAQQEAYPEDPLIVAVIDSGINSTHEMFRYQKWDRDQGCYVEDSRLLLYDDASFAAGGSGPVTNDSNGHGTHVAGIIADGTSNQIQILPIKIFPDAPYHDPAIATTDNLYPALLYARDHGADIINMSLGYNRLAKDTVALFDPLFREFREKDGIMCVAAAGNDSSPEPCYPATSFYVEAVSALKYTENGLELDFGYSNYGSEVTFAAPGTKILSAGTGSDTEYVLKSGTSMACPHVAAAMAMIKLYNPDYIPEEMIYAMDDLVWESEKTQPEGMYYYEGDGAGGYFGMPLFGADEFAPVPVVESIRNFTFKLKQDTFTYTGKKNYEAHVGELATYRKPVIWHVDGYYDYTAKKGEDFWEFSWANNNTVGTAVLGIRGYYPKLVGIKYYTYKIIPAGTTVKKLNRKGKKKIKVTWKKQAMKMSTKRVDGYQIQVATNKKFTKNKKTVKVKGYKKTSYTVKKLKAKKKYFVRIRTFMKVQGKTYYSNWSKAKAIKLR